MLRISQRDLEALRRHAEEAYPRECCGILLGRRRGETRSVSRIVACANMATPARARTWYQIAPPELIRAQREARARGLQIVGFYHSHPDHAARWSAADLAEAYWPGCSYVIVSVDHGRAAETNSFMLAGAEDDRHFEAEPLRAAAAVKERPLRGPRGGHR